MFTPTFWANFDVFIKVGQWLGANLYHSGAGKATFLQLLTLPQVARVRGKQRSRGQGQWLLFYVTAVYLWTDTAYLSWKLHVTPYRNLPGATSTDTFKTEVHAVTRAAACVFVLIYWLYKEEIASLINVLRNLDFEGLRLNLTAAQKERLATLSERLIQFPIFAVLFVTLQPLGPTISYLTEYPNIRYWHTGQHGHKYSWEHICFWAIWEYVLSFMSIYVVSSMCTVYVMQSILLTFWLSVVNTTAHPFGDHQHALYRKAQIFEILVNSAFSQTWQFGQVFLLLSHVSINAGAISMLSQGKMSQGLIFLAGASVIQGFEMVTFSQGGKIHSLSTEIRRQGMKVGCTRTPTLAFHLARARSYRRMALEVGSMYSLKIETGLQFQNQVLNNTVNYLLLKW